MNWKPLQNKRLIACGACACVQNAGPSGGGGQGFGVGGTGGPANGASGTLTFGGPGGGAAATGATGAVSAGGVTLEFWAFAQNPSQSPQTMPTFTSNFTANYFRNNYSIMKVGYFSARFGAQDAYPGTGGTGGAIGSAGQDGAFGVADYGVSGLNPGAGCDQSVILSGSFRTCQKGGAGGAAGGAISGNSFVAWLGATGTVKGSIT